MLLWVAKVIPPNVNECSFIYGLFDMAKKQKAFEQFINGHKDATYWLLVRHDDLYYSLKGYLVHTDYEHLYQLDLTAWKVQ